jgi:CheY-like chemotaxis protein/HPt (histidine-containing phosphotransfer) domain-containing protein/anti-sigma regulatory factor (Ser/Thr protein kinase)
MEIIPAEYEFASLINDVITIIRMRLREKPIYFVVNVDANIPKKLYGDLIRVRQILMNLLSNAAKYTNKGHILFTVDGFENEDGKITLNFEITDSGIGIKPEDLGKLFGDFAQVDTKTNKGVEGTGLGLAIARNLSRAMGGDITVESTYGEGTTFTAVIPQGIRDNSPLAEVAEPESKNVLVYEQREIYANSIVCSIDNLGVNCKLVTDQEEFTQALGEESFDFIFAASFLFDEAQAAIREREINTTLVLLAEYGEVIAERDVRFIAMPVYSLAVANILNHVEETRVYSEDEGAGSRFTAPSARILIVDDIRTNLDVAEGLLAPYAMTIDTCLNGPDAIRLVQENQYDMVLMDHMMPEMDGIETTKRIRELPGEYFQELPIIVVTANAIAGMRDMFLTMGFSDYVSKPIEILKLDEAIARWIPAGKKVKGGGQGKREKPEGADIPPIPGVDIAKGLIMTGGTAAGYRKVLTQFNKDVGERLPVFAAIPGETDLTAFAINAHAIKSAAGTIGAAEVSAGAARLEAAGKAGDRNTIQEMLPVFLESLTRLTQGIEAALDQGKIAGEKETGGKDTGKAIKETLLGLREALDTMNIREADRLQAELEKLTENGDASLTEAVTGITGRILTGEYDEAVELIDKLMTN